MSIGAMNWAFDLQHPDLKVASKAVLIALADNADEDHSCWPRVSTIMHKTGLTSRRSVAAALSVLTALGLVAVQYRYGDRSRYILAVGRQPPVVSAKTSVESTKTRQKQPGGVEQNMPGGRAYSAGGVGHNMLIREPPLQPPQQPPQLLLTEAVSAIDDGGFEEWWKWYPRKVGKGQARRAYRAAIKKIAPDALLEATRQYPFNPELGFVKHPATWLNAECWDDDPAAVVQANQAGDARAGGAADPFGLQAYLAKLPADHVLRTGYDPSMWEDILNAAGFGETWRGDLTPLAAWVTDRFRPDSIAEEIAIELARVRALPTPITPGSLQFFDRAVRRRAFYWVQNRLEWARPGTYTAA